MIMRNPFAAMSPQEKKLGVRDIADTGVE